MQAVITQISEVFLNVFRTLFSSDLDVMSKEVREILANPDDARLYKDAVKKIESGAEKSVTITLSDNRNITLVQ